MMSKGISKFRWSSINGVKEDNFSCSDFSFRFGFLFVDGSNKRKVIGMESMQRIGLDAVCMTFPGGEHINIFFCDSDTAEKIAKHFRLNSINIRAISPREEIKRANPQ